MLVKVCNQYVDIEHKKMQSNIPYLSHHLLLFYSHRHLHRRSTAIVQYPWGIALHLALCAQARDIHISPG